MVKGLEKGEEWDSRVDQVQTFVNQPKDTLYTKHPPVTGRVGPCCLSLLLIKVSSF